MSLSAFLYNRGPWKALFQALSLWSSLIHLSFDTSA